MLPPIPQNVTFRFFFHITEFLEKSADQEQAQGRDGSKLRGEIQRLGGLNATEISLLKKTAVNCNGQERDFQTGLTARMPDLAAKSRGVGQTADGAKREIASLSAAREKIVTDCVSQLKETLGAKRFGQLYAFAEAFVKPRLTYSDGKSSGAAHPDRLGAGAKK